MSDDLFDRFAGPIVVVFGAMLWAVVMIAGVRGVMAK